MLITIAIIRRALFAFELKLYEEVILDSQEILRLLDAFSVNARALMGRAVKNIRKQNNSLMQSYWMKINLKSGTEEVE